MDNRTAYNRQSDGGRLMAPNLADSEIFIRPWFYDPKVWTFAIVALLAAGAAYWQIKDTSEAQGQHLVKHELDINALNTKIYNDHEYTQQIKENVAVLASHIDSLKEAIGRLSAHHRESGNTLKEILAHIQQRDASRGDQ